MKKFLTTLFRGEQSRMVESKSGSPPLIALQLAGQANWTPRHFTALSREAYQRNPVAYRCIRMIAEAAASVRLCANCEDGTRLFRSDIMERFYGFLQLSGNGYLKLAKVDSRPISLYALSPDRISPKTNNNGRLVGYELDSGQGKTNFLIDPLSGQSDIFHLKLFHPNHDLYGFSPLEAAAQSVDIHNEGSLWTKALLDNSARPSGALVYSSASGEHLTPDQFDRLKTELESAYSGAKHAGRPMVLEGGLDWKSMSMSPSDMDFLEARREAAREIALAFGVPPMLLGIPGDNTFSNYREANQAFWRQTIIPLVNKTAEGLKIWLSPYFKDLDISSNLESVPALADERTRLWERLEAASFLSEEEKRVLAGVETHHA